MTGLHEEPPTVKPAAETTVSEGGRAGAIWARGTLATSASSTLAEEVSRKARVAFATFHEVKQVVSQFGRPDDGTDPTGFFNTEYFVDLQPREKWRPQYKNKEELIADLGKAVEQIPGTIWNFSQPIADNMEEAVSGVKGQLAVKIFGPDLKALEEKAEEIVKVMGGVPGVADLGIFRVMGQPNMNITVDRAKIDRFGINVSDLQDAIEVAVGGRAISQVLLGERRFDLVVRRGEPPRLRLLVGLPLHRRSRRGGRRAAWHPRRPVP